MKKAVFFDIDGTLWDRHMKIPGSTVEAVKRLRENGHYAFICSGRSRANICSPALLEIGFDGVVASCGAHIDFQEDRVFELLLSKEQVAYALDVLNRHQIPVILEGPQYIYLDEAKFQEDPYVLYLKKELGEKVKGICENTDFVINKMSISIKNANLDAVIEELHEMFDFIVHGEEIAEIIPKGYSKATGIEKVCEIFDIPLESTYAFGDSANDLEMLDFVAHGVAMGNGTREAKQAAEFVTTPIDENGIQNGLIHYGLI